MTEGASRDEVALHVLYFGRGSNMGRLAGESHSRCETFVHVLEAFGVARKGKGERSGAVDAIYVAGTTSLVGRGGGGVDWVHGVWRWAVRQQR
jgi:hypothetical protein